MFYAPKDGHGLPHDPFTSLVAPRPIGWISTVSIEGKVNLAPYSFFNAVCSRPPMVGFASEGIKDTVRNIRETGEFVVNVANYAMAEAMNLSSARLQHGDDEFAYAGLNAEPSQTVKAPRVAGVPAALECRLASSQEIITADGANTHNQLIIGQVSGIYIDDRCLVDGLFDVSLADLIARLGYRNYARVTEVFSMHRPELDSQRP